MDALQRKFIAGEKKQSGSALIIIIIAMVTMALLGAAVYTLNTTALFNQVAAQRAPKAFYLSESGVRIAASEYRTAVTAGNVNSKLPTLHAKTFNLPDNVSSFTLYIYPHWLYAKDASAAGASTITLYLPGALPRADETDTAISFPTSGLLRVKDTRSTTTTIWSGKTDTSYTGASPGTFSAANGTPVTFTLSTAFTDAIEAGDEFYIGYLTTKDAIQTGTSLTLYIPTNIDSINMAKYFPPQGGTIFVPQVAMANSALRYKYDARIIDSAASPINVTLTNIQDLYGNSATPAILNGTKVYIGRSVGFRSTSAYGGQ